MPDLPTGTITFLFTDIEGSTKRWEEHPEAMRLALARHDALMRAAIEHYDGHIFKTIGDACCAAFHTALDALNAALAAQLALHSEAWPGFVTIKVRMALHTGAAELRNNDYFGQPLNRVARLLSAGHGGQVLLSDVAHDLCRDALPPSVTMQSLGEHRLRDLHRPEPVFQLAHPDLPAEFPPIKSLNNPELPNNLPQQLTSFIGREKEMTEVKGLLSKTRMLTLTGSGGCGKSRLSLQVAADELEEFPDGVWLVELAPLSDPSLVPQVVAQVLGVKEQAGQSLQQTLTEHLRNKRLLLVLDNCEHLLATCAQLVSTLLRSCPTVKVVATSREPLGVTGEQTYRTPSLSLPDAKQVSTPQSLNQYEAVRLFIERALLVKSDFAVTNQNAPALAQLCCHLDGIPLAIELAAARVRSLPVEDINARLDNRFRLLTGGDRSALPRQQTLRALIDWSYELLNQQERLMLGRLSVFAGGATVDAAEQVCTDDGVEDWEVLDLLSSLADKSLVVAEEQDGSARYRMLETLRQYPRERLIDNEESLSVNQRHRDYFLTLAEKTMPKLNSSEQAYWLGILEAEHDNLRQALAFCLEELEGGKAGLRLSAMLVQFWQRRGYLNEGRQHMRVALSRPIGPECQKERADALYGSGVLAQFQGDYVEARSHLTESLTIYRKLEDKQGIAQCLQNLGNVAHDQSDFRTACAHIEESLTIRQELEDQSGIAASLGSLANVAAAQGDYTNARTLYEEGLAIRRKLEDQWGMSASLGNLGSLIASQGDYATARVLQEESLAISRKLGDRQSIAYGLSSLGLMAHDQGDYADARALYEESLTINQELGTKRGIVACFGFLGNVSVAQGDYATAHTLLEKSLETTRETGEIECISYCLDTYVSLACQEQRYIRAARLSGAATALYESIGSLRPPIGQKKYDQQVAQARLALGESAFTIAWNEGRAMSWEQAVVYALEEN